MSDADPPILPGDGAAATVLLLRDGARGPEVLVALRPSDRGSYAGALVFPGGAVDAADAADDGLHSEAAARRAAARETHEEVGLVVAPDDLVTVSVWHPPIGAPKRLHTHFFAAPVPAGEIVLSPDELVATEWARPAEVLERHAAKRVILYPPTWVTLHGLAGAASVAEALAGYAARPVPRFVGRFDDDRTVLYWREDTAFAGDGGDPAGGDDGGPRHRLVMRGRPWIYERALIGAYRIDDIQRKDPCKTVENRFAR